MATTEGEPFSYIFPFMSNEYLYGPDIHEFQFLMYRPLYWWNGSPYKLTLSRSLADYPTFKNNDKTVTIKLKRWKWSDGQTLSPQSVAFFMGLLLTEYATFWSYIPGDFPDSLASTSYDNAADTVTFHLKESVNPTWFLENQLLMITPFPTAWDLSGPGKKSDCESETVKVEKADCPAVYKYLTAQSKDTTTYATNPLWQVVDGPFHLTKFASGGTSVTLEPNKSYTGSPKARISKLVFDVPTSTASEYSLLQSGALTIGYVPFTSAPTKSPGASKPPSNPVPGDDLVSVGPIWAYNDVFWNYNNPKLGPLVHELYFRQAMESLVDQKADIQTALRGYGFYDVGPNPPDPTNVFETSYEKTDPYSYSPAHARKYLTSNGWKIPSSGAAYCVRPGTGKGECGKGITHDEKIPSITLQYSSGNQTYALEMSNLQSDAAGAGIEITPVATASGTIDSEFPSCTPNQSECKWQMIYLGTADVDTDVPYPLSTVVFKKGAVFNVSNYLNAYVTALCVESVTQPGNKALDTLDNYLVKTAALLWMPVPDNIIYEVNPKLKGFVESPILTFQPETLHFS